MTLSTGEIKCGIIESPSDSHHYVAVLEIGLEHENTLSVQLSPPMLESLIHHLQHTLGDLNRTIAKVRKEEPSSHER